MAALVTFKVDMNLKTGQPSVNLLPEVTQLFKEKLGEDLTTSV